MVRPRNSQPIGFLAAVYGRGTPTGGTLSNRCDVVTGAAEIRPRCPEGKDCQWLAPARRATRCACARRAGEGMLAAGESEFVSSSGGYFAQGGKASEKLAI